MSASIRRIIPRSIVLFVVFCVLFFPTARAVPVSESVQPADLPVGAAPAIAKAMLKTLPAEYQLRDHERGYTVSNPLHGTDIVFDPKGPQLTSHGHRWGLVLSAVGYEGKVNPVSAARLGNQDGRMVYQRGDLSEWYINSKWGIEQGFTLRKAPEGRSLGGSLVVELTLWGDLLASLETDTLTLADTQGNTVVHYSGLQVFDHNEEPLPARFTLTGNLLRILVDDQEAEYPIVIDPWIQTATLTTSVGSIFFGPSIAISGNTVAIGAPGSNDDKGAVIVYEKPASGWTDITEVARLYASDRLANDGLGRSVSMEGDTIIAGANGDDNNTGSAYVFVKPATGWETAFETAKLTASERYGGDAFGNSVSLSGDVAVIGGHFSDRAAYTDNLGIAYIFVKPVDGWISMTETAKLTTGDTGSADYFAESVSISGDTVVVGADRADGAAATSGAAYIFVKPAGGWTNMTTHTAKLRQAYGVTNDGFGYATAISEDGQTVVVSAPFANFGYGIIYIFNKPANGWAGTLPHNAELSAADSSSFTYFGTVVTIKDDMIGAVGSFKPPFVFEKPAGGWASAIGSPIDGWVGPNGVAVSADFVVASYTGNWALVLAQITPKVTKIDSVEDTGDASISEAEEIRVAVTQLLVTFNTNVSDPAGDVDANDVTNPANYLLIEAGVNKAFDTVDCAGGLVADDAQVSIDSVTYDSGSKTSTLNLNGGAALPVGSFRLLVCGTTSIEDVAGQKLDGNGDGTTGDDFVINFSIPDTNGDGEPDYLDPDDDGDGLSDEYEEAHPVLDPLNPDDADEDPDNDGLTSLEEFNIDPLMNPDDPDTDGDGIQDNIDSKPTVASNICSGAVAVLQSVTITEAQQCAASTSVLVEGNVKVDLLGYLEIISGEVTLNPGFAVDGEFLVISEDPCPACL